MMSAGPLQGQARPPQVPELQGPGCIIIIITTTTTTVMKYYYES